MLLYKIVDLLFLAYTIMLFIRVVGSWFPQWQHTTFMRFIYHYTEPYLGFFRKIIPPLGILDLSPLIAFIVLQLIKSIILRIIL